MNKRLTTRHLGAILCVQLEITEPIMEEYLSIEEAEVDIWNGLEPRKSKFNMFRFIRNLIIFPFRSPVLFIIYALIVYNIAVSILT